MSKEKETAQRLPSGQGIGGAGAVMSAVMSVGGLVGAAGLTLAGQVFVDQLDHAFAPEAGEIPAMDGTRRDRPQALHARDHVLRNRMIEGVEDLAVINRIAREQDGRLGFP
jgi:hypothetical protein